MHILNEMAIDAMHTFFDMDIDKVHGDARSFMSFKVFHFSRADRFFSRVGRFFETTVKFFDDVDAFFHVRRRKVFDWVAIVINQVSFLISAKNSSEDPTMTMEVAKLAVLGLGVEVGHIVKEIRVRPVASC